MYSVAVSVWHRVSTPNYSIAVFGDFFCDQCGIWQIFLRYCSVESPPMSPSTVDLMARDLQSRLDGYLFLKNVLYADQSVFFPG